MRRLPTVLLAFYLIFLGGSAYYTQLFVVRAAHHVIVTVLLLIWLFNRVRRGRGVPPTPFNILLYAAVALWLVTALFALDPRIAIESAWFPITHVLIFLYIAALFQAGRGRIVMEAVFLIGALVVIAAGVQAINWLQSWLPLLSAEMPFPPVLPRLDQPFGVTTWLSAFAAPLIVIAAAWALTVRRRDYRPALWGLAAALAIVLVSTTSRGGFIALAAAVAIVVVLRLWSRPSINRVIPVAFGALVIAGLIGGVIFLISRDSSRAGGDVLRVDLWRTAVEAVQDYPVTGVGVGMFGRAHRIYRDPTYVDDRLGTAHNLYLLTAAETGIPGILLLLALIGVGARAWHRQWRTAESDGRRFRLEAAAAALIGFGIQSLFDNFTQTNTVILPLVLAAYVTIPPRDLVDTPLKGSQIMAGLLAALIAAFGVGLFLSDRAQSSFDQSVRTQSIDAAETALSADPGLRLYELQRLYLIAHNPDTPVDTAIRAYTDAVWLEPTWDTAWINLVPLYLSIDDVESARLALERAATINNWNGAWFGWAYLSEQERAAPSEEIIQAYVRSLTSPPDNAEFWQATAIRQEAVTRYAESQSLEIRYQTYAAIDPDRAAALVPSDPHTAEEWWIVGHYALIVQGDRSRADAAFTEAIRRSPARADLYIWRAQARQDDPVERDRALAIAEQLGESAWAARMRITFADTPEQARLLRLRIVGSRTFLQNFEGVLFQGRRAAFVTVQEWSGEPLKPDELALWFDLADEFAAAGDRDTAAQILRLFLETQPSNAQARERLAALEGGA